MTISKDKALITESRAWLHTEIINRGVLAVNSDGIATNADKGNTPSRKIAKSLADQLMSGVQERQAGQTSGAKFEVLIKEFLERTFPKLQNIRPGEWEIVQLGNRNKIKTSSFVQYEHLEYLQALTDANAVLKTIVGSDYMVAPDVVVYRKPIDDAVINDGQFFVDDQTARLSELRLVNNDKPLLLALSGPCAQIALRIAAQRP